VGIPQRLLIVCLLPVVLAGCNGIVANDLSEAPNLDSPMRGQDAPADLLADHHVSRQLRVNVGPPAASLSVWIVDPIVGPGKVWYYPDALGGANVGITIDTTRAATRPIKPPKGTLFLLHGWGDDKEVAAYEFYSLVMASAGYRVVLVDLRGHGRSTGDRITFGAVESHDLVQVLDQLDHQGLIVGNVGIIGVSYGAATAICWAAIDPRVRAVVALEPFSSLRDSALDGGPLLLGSDRWMFSDRDLVDIVRQIGVLGRFDPDKSSPLAAITHMNTPILLIHGKSDTFLHPTESIRLHEAAPDHSRLILVDGANHLTLCLMAEKMITSEADEWFAEYLDPPATTPSKP
jgi:pimeloyl-ACP methyl ester carboxylesterase